MNEEDLSPEAQYKLRELEGATLHSGDWVSNYLAMLKDLAERKLPDLADVEIKGQGLEAWEISRKEHAIAAELKAYAIANTPIDISAELAKLPEWVSLDDFLNCVMPNTGKQVLRDRFMRFLVMKAEREVDEQMALHPKPGVSRANYLKRMAKSDFSRFDEQGLHALTQHEYGGVYRSWWMSQDAGNPLTVTNAARTCKKAEKMEKMLGLLPHTKRANETMCLDDWRKKAKQLLNIPSSTFDKYRKELEPRFVEKPKWRFRVDTAKPSEKM